MKEGSNTNKIISAWSHAWSFMSFRIQAIATLVAILTIPIIMNRFFDFVEARQGVLLNDYLLNYIPSYNASMIVFFFLYSGIFVGIYYHLLHPKTILIAFQTYVLVTLLRVLTITLVPLEPPIGYIPLREPFVQLFTSNGRIISKDLFFSGHMSTILSLFFSSHRKFVRTFLFYCSCMVGVMVLIQHVHYTIDVVVAIPITFVIYLFCKNVLGGRAF